MDNDERNDKPKKRYRKKNFRLPIGKILGTVFVLFLLVYIVMLVYTSNFSMIETEQVTHFEINDYLEVNAVALRREEYILNNRAGVVAYDIDDGEKVNAGGAVARLFENASDVENWQKYQKLNSELDMLKQLGDAGNSIFVDLDTVDAQITTQMVSYRNQLQSGRYNIAQQTKLSLLQLYNERAVITGISADFQPRISELETEISEISVSKGIGEVKSKNSGIFVSVLDGYENSLDYSKAQTLTSSEVAAITRKDPPSDAVGKIITTLNWYLLCPITGEQAISVTASSGNVEVSIPKVISYSVPGTIVSVNQGSKTEDGLLVIQCDYMDSALAKIRREDITIKTQTYEGLRINRKAIHEDYITVNNYDENGNITDTYEQKVQGVYVVYGNKLNFVQVNIIYSDKEFVICDPDVTNPAILGDKTVSLYDEVVVQGKELYNGKIVK